MTRLRCGFTLVEVALALLLAALVALVAARLLAGSRQAEASVSTASDRGLALDLGADLLARQLRWAGYVPYPAPSAVALDAGEPELVLTVGPNSAHGDAVRVRYLDDSLATGVVARDLRFDAALDGRGEAQLYRATATGRRQPLVQGITAVRVVGWADASGLHGRAELTAGRLEPWLLLLSLITEGGRERTVAAPLPSRPLTQVVMGP